MVPFGTGSIDKLRATIRRHVPRPRQNSPALKLEIGSRDERGTNGSSRFFRYLFYFDDTEKCRRGGEVICASLLGDIKFRGEFHAPLQSKFEILNILTFSRRQFDFCDFREYVRIAFWGSSRQ